MKRIISLLLMTIMIISSMALISCGGGEGSAPSADSKYIGVWKATKAEVKDQETPMDEILDAEYILDLREDGTAVVTYETEATGTWTEKSDGVHVSAGDTNADFKADGDYLVITILNAEILFEKQ